jgi:hypothetical protein
VLRLASFQAFDGFIVSHGFLRHRVNCRAILIRSLLGFDPLPEFVVTLSSRMEKYQV